MKLETQEALQRELHPQAIKECTFEGVLCLLGVGADLRSRKIPAIHYNQGYMLPDKFMGMPITCGTACCIAGWAKYRLGIDKFINAIDDAWNHDLYNPDGSIRVSPIAYLFSGRWPSDPDWAADAIDEYCYNYADNPWKEASKLVNGRWHAKYDF